jgi:drug/metabolite transporter (DMT)-like permease
MKSGLEFVSPITYVAHRVTLSAITLSPILLISPKRIPRDSKTLGNLVLLSLVNIASILVAQVGLAGESSGLGSVLTYTQPLFVFCLAIPFLKEKFTWISFLGTTVGFVGIVMLFIGRLGSFILSSTIVLVLGAFLWAVTIVFYKKCLTQVDPLTANLFQLSVGAVPLLILGLITNNLAFPSDTTYVWMILYSSVGASTIAMTVWLFLIREEDATVLAGSSFLIPLVALPLGWQILGENLGMETTLGSALIISGILLVNIRRKDR